jgi:hypothetical protein
MNRASTIGHRLPICRVILRNTSAVNDGEGISSGSSGLHRSQSLLTTRTKPPILAPPRSERARLENLLEDVWSRDILPFPGIGAGTRGGHLVRASSMMRRMSMASLAGSLRRSASLGRTAKKLSEGAPGGPCGHLESTELAKPRAGPRSSLRVDSEGTPTAVGPKLQEMKVPDKGSEAESMGLSETVRRIDGGGEDLKSRCPPEEGRGDLSSAPSRNSSVGSERYVASSPSRTATGHLPKEENPSTVQGRGSLGRWAKSIRRARTMPRGVVGGISCGR